MFKKLAELNILINTLTLQEARDSSAIENIVTTQDDLYREEASASAVGTATKGVLRYRQALTAGYDQVRTTGLLTLDTYVNRPLFDLPRRGDPVGT
ncbi:MAG TPA: Fic/DOC family N-terminal domain-containing protein [Pseudoxanthomonas sp.]|nr:Fic/DOC family N-terminal domain-containing protein [Pseudoxanthomonas sp.]